MKQVLQHVRSGELEIVEVPEPTCRWGGLLVRNEASLISAGTERMVIEFAGKSLLGKARERPDLVRQVVDKVRKDGLGPTMATVKSRLDQPIALGYSCAGVVEQVGRGAEGFSVGDRVACAGMGYASHADVVWVPKNLVTRVPDGVSIQDAAYVTVGAIALQGVRIAEARLGECIAVIGLGLLGQITVQILKANGCRVIGIDLDPEKVELAKRLGADAAMVRGPETVAAVERFSGGFGADAVIVTAAADSNDPIELAGELCRDRGIVSMVGAVRMDIPRKVFFEKELQLRLSRSYGPGRYDPAYEEGGADYPIGYVRWTEGRNMEEFLRLVSTGQVTPSRMTTHDFPIQDAERAYQIVTGEKREPFLGILLSYPVREARERITFQTLRPPQRSGKVRVGFIGAGQFARSVLLPRLSSGGEAEMVGVATATGVSGRATADKFGFQYCTTDMERLLGDPSVEAVFIATRHASHARLAARALAAGKSVFVEKPLAIDEEGLQEVLDALSTSGGLLTVGFNRRFSPLVTEIRDALRDAGPLSLTYRINSGDIPADSWIHDAAEGGGRIIGEVCHFVDLLDHIVGARPIEVFAYGLGGMTAPLHDTVTIVLRYPDGSIGNINYFSTGDRSHPKEQLEVFGGGGIAILDDFRRLLVTRGGKKKQTRRISQDKGFDQEIAGFLAAVRGAAPPPIALESLVATTRACFAIEESLRSGQPVRVDGL